MGMGGAFTNTPGTPLFQQPGVTKAPKPPQGSGYSYDPVKGEYTPTVGSTADDLAQRTRDQAHQDLLSSQEQTLFPSLANAAGTNTTSLTANGNINAFGAGLDTPPPPPTSLALSGIKSALQGSRDATYAAAKDRAANTTTAALNGLQEELQRRGMGGAGYEAGQVGNNLATEANTIGQVDRQGMEDELGLETHLADEDYQGQLTQRGQDISANEANANRTLAAREAAANNGLQTLSVLNQDRTAKLAMLTNALAGLNRAY